MNRPTVRIRYCNYRGEISGRLILPHKIRFGSNQWHPVEQWLLFAFDLDKQAMGAGVACQPLSTRLPAPITSSR